MFQFQ